MRVLITISSVQMGGAERNLISVLPHLRRAGVDVTVATLTRRLDSPLAGDLTATGVRRIDLGARRMVDRHAWRRYEDALRGGRFDLVHAQDQDSTIYAALAHRLRRVPSVMTRHVLREPDDTWREGLRARAVISAARFGFDGVIAVSEAVRYQFAALARIPVSRIATVYNGIDTADFDLPQGTRERMRQELGWPLDQPVVMMVAVLRRGKGHDVLFDAIPRIRATAPGARVVVVGEGELGSELRETAHANALDVEFLGQRMDVPELLAAADVLVLPSWSEALPGVLLEAGAAGRPAVATDVGGAAEIISSGESGFIIPRGDAEALADRVSALLTSPELASAMGSRASRIVRSTFTLERQATRTAALYQAVVSKPRERR